MMIDFNDISGILDESNRTYKKDILDFNAVSEKLLNESSNNKVNESNVVIAPWRKETAERLIEEANKIDPSYSFVEYDIGPKKEIKYKIFKNDNEYVGTFDVFTDDPYNSPYRYFFHHINVGGLEFQGMTIDEFNKDFNEFIELDERVGHKALNEARVFSHSSGFGLSGHYDYETPEEEPLYIATETNEDDGELYFDETGCTTEFETNAKKFTSEEEALEFAKNNVIFGEPGTKLYEKSEKDFYEAWKKVKSKPLNESYATTKLKPSVFIKRHSRYFKHPCTVDDFYHLLKKSNRNYSLDSEQPLPLPMLDNLLDELRELYVDAGVDILKNDKHILLGESTNMKNNRFNESLHNNDDSINNLISKIEVYKDIVSNSWIPMPWEVTYSKVPEGLKLTIDTDEWFDKENPLGRLIDFILDIYNSDYDSSVRELTGIDIYSDVEFLGGEKSGYATYLIKSSNNDSTKLHESIQGTVGDFCELKGIDTDQFVEFLQTNFDWARHCEAWTIVDFDCLERCFSKLDEATIAQAKRFASRKHGERGQVRKATGAPYIVHPEGVAKIVKDFGGDDEQIQAAWLHDTMEDTGTWEEDLREKFGDRVADLVSELTNDDFAIRSIGKEDYMSNKLINLSDDALLIKLSDFLYNIKDHCPMKTLERMKKNLEALNFSGRKLDDKCDKLLIDCLEAIDEEM